jgi:hypothetical protein
MCTSHLFAALDCAGTGLNRVRVASLRHSGARRQCIDCVKMSPRAKGRHAKISPYLLIEAVAVTKTRSSTSSYPHACNEAKHGITSRSVPPSCYQDKNILCSWSYQRHTHRTICHSCRTSNGSFRRPLLSCLVVDARHSRSSPSRCH